jgi:hypothetical protein
MYVQSSASEIQTPNVLEPDRPQHDRLVSCVIAQQYSSATLVFLRSHPRKQKFLFAFQKSYYIDGVTRWRSWSRHCATSRKVMGSIPDCVIAIFH